MLFELKEIMTHAIPDVKTYSVRTYINGDALSMIKATMPI